MTQRITEKAAKMVADALRELGLRPMRNGHVELHFDSNGALVGSEERRRTRYVGDPVAQQATQAHNSSGS